MPETGDERLASRVGEAMVWNSLAAPVKAALTMATSIVTARLLGPHDYGAYAVLLSVLTTLGQYADLGINRSLPRFIPWAEVRYGAPGVRSLLRDVLLAKTTMAGAAAIALVLGAAPVARWLDLGDDGALWMRLVAVVFAVETFREIALRVLSSYFRQKLTNAVEIVTLALQPLATGLVLWLGGRVAAVVLVVGGCSLVAAVWLGIAAARVIRDTPRRAALADPHAPARSMVPHAATIYLLLVTKYFAELSFVVFLLAWAGVEKARIAQFALAYKIVGMGMNLLAIPLQSIQVPLMARMDATVRPDAFERAYTVLLKYLLFALAPGAALIVLLAPELIALLYGEPYLPAASLIRILTPLLALETLFNLSSNVLMIKGDYRDVAWLRGAGLAAAPAVAAAALWGSPAVVAVVLGAGRTLVAWAGYRIATHRHRLGFPMAFAGQVTMASAGLVAGAVVVSLLAPTGWVSLLSGAVAGSIGFVVTFHLLGGFDPEEKRLLGHLPIPGVARLARWM